MICPGLFRYPIAPHDPFAEKVLASLPNAVNVRFVSEVCSVATMWRWRPGRPARVCFS